MNVRYFTRHKNPLIVTAIILGFIVAGIITLTPWVWVDPRPKPLGEGLVYLGKRDYGCIGFCSMPIGAEYYYGTEMSEEEVGGYFKKAHLEKSSLQPYELNEGKHLTLSFRDNGSEDGFSLSYYENGLTRAKAYGLASNQYRHLVSIDYKSYKTGVKALR